MTWPFSCRACKSKDSEIAFYRELLGSTRTLYRDPAPQPEPERRPVDLSGLAELARREAQPAGLEYAMSSFSHNPIQSYEVTDGSDRIIDDDGAPD